MKHVWANYQGVKPDATIPKPDVTPPSQEPEPRIDPEHPERPKFGFSPAPFVQIKTFDLKVKY